MNTDDIKQRLDQANASPTGITIAFERIADAKSFRMACYTYRRKVARAGKSSPHAVGHTPYDDLVIRITPPAIVIIEPARPIPHATAIPTPTPDQAQ